MQKSRRTHFSMIKPFLHNEEVALVTAPNFEMFHNQLSHPFNWLQISELLEGLAIDSICYVDACTAVSYAIGVRRAAIDSPYLMDPEFGMGYGEDSDLHYQLVTKGWKSVWTLDTVVSHFGGASFGHDAKADGYRKFGRELFFKRWGDLYFSEIESHEIVLHQMIRGQLQGLDLNQHSTSLVITPSDKPYIGGLVVVKSFVKGRIFEKRPVQLLILDEINGKNYYDLMTTLSSEVNWDTTQEIVFVGIGSVRWFMNLNIDITNKRIVFFLQGPDWVIDPDGVAELAWLQENKVELIVTSPVTAQIARQLNPLGELQWFVPSLDSARYGGYENFDKDFDVIMSVRSEYGKGGHLAESLIKTLSKKCRIQVVSDIPLTIDSGNVIISRRTGESDFLKKLARSKVYIDTSIYEGFGLVPRQAGLLNVKCLLFPFAGGTNELLSFPNHFQSLNDPFDLLGNVELILNSLDSPSCEGCSYCN